MIHYLIFNNFLSIRYFYFYKISAFHRYKDKSKNRILPAHYQYFILFRLISAFKFGIYIKKALKACYYKYKKALSLSVKIKLFKK